MLFGAVIGGILFVAIEVAVAAAQGRKPSPKQLAVAFATGALGGLVGGAILGVGKGAVGLTRVTAAGATAGAVSGGSYRAGTNVVEGRPVGEGVVLDTAIGGTLGAAIPPAARGIAKVTEPVRRRIVESVTHVRKGRGLSGALRGEGGGAVRVTTRAFRSVHPPPPTWLKRAFERTVAGVRSGSGPDADPKAVRGFLAETYEHIREVNALVKAMGGKARPLTPENVARGRAHDFGERASVRRVEELIAELRRNPVTTREGVPLEVPHWLAELPRNARLAGETTIDVGKLSPHVAAGLGRAGPPDPFAIRLHNLSGHHFKGWSPRVSENSSALMEAVADRINAMRQVRVYRPEPMPFEKIRAIILSEIDEGVLPPAARPLLERGLEAQRLLERLGRVNPYHTLEPAAVEAPAVAGAR